MVCTVEGLSFSPSLQTHQFDVNRERTEEGDLLVHVAVQGGESAEPVLWGTLTYCPAPSRPGEPASAALPPQPLQGRRECKGREWNDSTHSGMQIGPPQSC